LFAFASAHLFRCAAAIFLRAAGLIVCLALTGFEGFAFTAAYLFLCAAAILLRAAGLSGRLPVWLGAAAGVPSPEPSWRRMSAIFSSTLRLICSNPIKAASSKDVSAVLRPVGIYKCDPGSKVIRNFVTFSFLLLATIKRPACSARFGI
jgi:hypothetical protein